MESWKDRIIQLLDMLEEKELRIVVCFISGMLREKRGK